MVGFMKKIIFSFILFPSLIFSENISSEIIQERAKEIAKILQEKSRQNEIDDEYRWFQGYYCALEYIISIID